MSVSVCSEKVIPLLNNDLWMKILELTDLVTVAQFARVSRSSREASRAVMRSVEDYITFRRVKMDQTHFCRALKLKSEAAEHLDGIRQSLPLDNDTLREALRMWPHK